jgi:glycosyltransferase involved in cell wall biosynthesis
MSRLLRGRRSPSAAAPQTDAVDEAAIADLAREQPELRLPPVVLLIAAYDEAAGLPAVLGTLPHEVCGLPAEVLVVDDGSKDGTAAAARETGRGLVVSCPVNRGQGRALRLGYRIAREYRATYVVTTDADGQYSPEDIDAVLGPVVEGRADLVSGSRRLGAVANPDRVRQAGTYVFAWLASLLLGRRITDTSFGLRAMRADMTAALTLNQPQYQASELLIGALSHGFRYAEVPATMRVRSAGSSKKGGNLAYGSRYARVMLGTWWREGCPRAGPSQRGTP